MGSVASRSCCAARVAKSAARARACRWSSRCAAVTVNSMAFVHGGPDMAPKPPSVRRAPAKPWRASLFRESEPLVAFRGDGVADLAVGAYTADVGHEDARLARDVGAHVPGVGA